MLAGVVQHGLLHAEVVLHRVPVDGLQPRRAGECVRQLPALRFAFFRHGQLEGDAVDVFGLAGGHAAPAVAPKGGGATQRVEAAAVRGGGGRAVFFDVKARRGGLTGRGHHHKVVLLAVLGRLRVLVVLVAPAKHPREHGGGVQQGTYD